MSDAKPENATFWPQTLLGAAMVWVRAQRATKLEEARSCEEEMDVNDALEAESRVNFKGA